MSTHPLVNREKIGTATAIYLKGPEVIEAGGLAGMEHALGVAVDGKGFVSHIVTCEPLYYLSENERFRLWDYNTMEGYLEDNGAIQVPTSKGSDQAYAIPVTSTSHRAQLSLRDFISEQQNIHALTQDRPDDARAAAQAAGIVVHPALMGELQKEAKIFEGGVTREILRNVTKVVLPSDSAFSGTGRR